MVVLYIEFLGNQGIIYITPWTPTIFQSGTATNPTTIPTHKHVASRDTHW